MTQANFLKVVKDSNFAFAVEQIITLKDGCRVIFRTYSLDNECGGFQSDWSVKGANEQNIFMALNNIPVLPDFLLSAGFKIVSKSTNNKVPACFHFNKIKNFLN